MAEPIQSMGAPASEFCEAFVHGMRSRMAVSYHKYGRVADATGIDKLLSLEKRIDKYRERRTSP
jgi:hypothetical protein